MTIINPYLNFDGNCQEAFDFYKSIFGGEFSYVGKFKDMPDMGAEHKMSEADGEKLMHISLPISKETNLMGSDMMEGYGPPFQLGNNISLSINSDSKEAADTLYSKLSAGGHAAMPMDNAFWGSYFGMLTDKYGINWMISVEQKPE